MTTEGLLIILIVGLVAGWLASVLVRGGGMGLLGDLLVGLVGSLIGTWLAPQIHLSLGTGIAAEIIYAVLGAVILLVIIRLVFGFRRRRL
jgi:uncharacterized membrane protein YeaQ/YmgE (transglycosylase-associated protein family)